MNLISQDYLNQITLLHECQVWGASGYSHAATVAQYQQDIGAKTLLDYGCGRGTLKPELIKLGIEPWAINEYDPAIKGKDLWPPQADLLVATDVLEHIEPEHIGVTLDHLRWLAIKGAFFTIALTLSKVSLPDGRNAHLIIEPQDWWLYKLRTAGFEIVKAEPRKGLWVWTK